MSYRVLVTGGTGTLGRVVMELLARRGIEAKAMSRRTGGDLVTGRGLDEAVSGVDTVIHCATTRGRKDLMATGNLIAVTAKAHLVYISMVGVDRIPLGFYRTKLACERLIEESGGPFTILRTTQFHDLLFMLFAVQRSLPAVIVPAGFRFQPIDTSVVAARLVDLAEFGPAGRVADMGGPEVHTAAALAGMYLRAKGSRRRAMAMPIPGKTAAGFREGYNLTPNSVPGLTFKQFLDLKLA